MDDQFIAEEVQCGHYDDFELEGSDGENDLSLDRDGGLGKKRTKADVSQVVT